MKIKNFGEYNFNDMLAVMEDEMETHMEAIAIARTGISRLFTELENMSAYICYLEGILKEMNIEYFRYDDTDNEL